MLSRKAYCVSLGLLFVVTSTLAAKSESSKEKAGSDNRDGSSTDTVKVRKNADPDKAELRIHVEAQLADAVAAVKSLGMSDAKKLADVKLLELVLHLDAVSKRLNHRAGEEKVIKGSAAKKVWATQRGIRTHAIFGPYIRMEPGRYVMVYRMMSPEKSTGRMASLSIASDASGKVGRDVETSELPVGKWRTFAVPFTVDKTWGRVEFRIAQYVKPLVIDRLYLFKVN